MKLKSLLGITGILLITGMLIVSCLTMPETTSERTAGSANPFVGMWIYEEPGLYRSTLVFTETEVTEVIWISGLATPIPAETVTYTFSGNTAILNFFDERRAVLSGGVLIVGEDTYIKD